MATISSATRVLQCADLLQHVLQWCYRIELVALACTQRVLRQYLMNSHNTIHMTKLWPKHMLHVQVSDARRWDELQASPTGRAVRHLDFSQLVVTTDEQANERDWMTGWTYPLVSLKLFGQTHNQLTSIYTSDSKSALAEYLWYACCGDNESPPTPASIQNLQQHAAFFSPIPATSSRSVFVEATSRADIIRYRSSLIPRVDLPMNMVLKIANQWPATRLVNRWLASSACHSLATIAYDFRSTIVSKLMWEHITILLLHNHLHGLRHLEIMHPHQRSLSLLRISCLARLTLLYTGKVSISVISRVVRLARQAARNAVIDIACDHVYIFRNDVQEPSEDFLMSIRQGCVTWSPISITMYVDATNTVDRLCQALREAPSTRTTPPVVLVRIILEDLGALIPCELKFIAKQTRWEVCTRYENTLDDIHMVHFMALLNQLRCNNYPYPAVIKLNVRTDDQRQRLAQHLSPHLPSTTLLAWGGSNQLRGYLVRQP
jgi:hypothetical protein